MRDIQHFRARRPMGEKLSLAVAILSVFTFITFELMLNRDRVQPAHANEFGPKTWSLHMID